jgi:CRISPR system Cascade subunit CasE
MYLSRLYLNPRNRQVRDDLADRQELHRTVMSGFPRADGEARRRFSILYRLEVRRGTATLLVQSEAEPDWSNLKPGYLGAPPACKRVDAAYEAVASGQTLRFRLHANPTKRIPPANPRKRTGPRVELQREEDQLHWLRRKGEMGGFELLSVQAAPALQAGEGALGGEVPDVRAVSQAKVIGRRLRDHAGHAKLTFGSVLFDGELRVTDIERFREALRTGIGSGKAYGFGLLSIAPA